MVETAAGFGSSLFLRFADHIEGNAGCDLVVCANSVYGFLRLAVATVGALDGIRGGRQEPVVQKRQSFFQVGGLELLEDVADLAETPHPLAQFGQLGKGRVGAATTVEEAIDFIHDLPQRAQVRQATRDVPQRFAFGLGQMMADEQETAVEQGTELGLQAFTFLGESLIGFARFAAGQFWLLSGEFLAFLGQRTQDGLGQFRNGVELANLVELWIENFCNRQRVQRGRIGGDATQGEAALLKKTLEFSEERPDVLVRRIMIEDLVADASEGAVVHDGQDAIGAVVKFVGRDVTGEVGQGPIKIGPLDLTCRFFFPPPPPSFGWLPRGRKHGGRARGANWLPRTAGHPRQRGGPPWTRRDACSELWAPRGRTCQR